MCVRLFDTKKDYNLLFFFSFPPVISRMFPTVAVMLSDLMPNTLYAVSLRFVLADDYRHKFVNGCWELTGKSEIIHDESKMVFQHPSSPTTGEIWMKKPISFKAIKITHFPKSAHGNVS